MNELSLVNGYCVAAFHANNLVNTVSLVKTDDMDLNKENIYPLVNIDLIDSEILDDAIVISYKMTVVQARDEVPRVTDSKLLTDINVYDNLNETHSIAQRFINVLRRQNNDENIEIDELSVLTMLKDWRNGLDGVQFDIDLSIPNLGTAC